MEEEIILVDENDKEIGSDTKLNCHLGDGKLHRAFSIFVFNSEGKFLLQKRAKSKYHFGGLWTNTCCSHPRKGEELGDAVHRRLNEEFGFDTELKEIFSFIYHVDAGNGLSEYEFDHVFVGEFDGAPVPNPEEIEDWKWIEVEELKKDVKENSKKYTPWFKIALEKYFEQSK